MDPIYLFEETASRFQFGKNLQVKFHTVISLAEVVKEINGNIVLIKKSLTTSDLSALQNASGKITIFADNPGSIEEYDIRRDILEAARISVNPMENIDINFLWGNDTLYAFSNTFNSTTLPNMVSFFPVDYSIIQQKLTVEQHTEQQEVICQETPLIGQYTLFDENKTENRHSKEVDPELVLLRKKINEEMTELYCTVKIELKKSAIKQKTIPLTDFYRKNKISNGRLKGSWVAIDRDTADRYSDTRIVQKAIQKIKDNYTVPIESTYRIIKKTEMEILKHALKNVSLDISKYYCGEDVSHIGNAEITSKFDFDLVTQNSKNELIDYLQRACNNTKSPKVNDFVDESYAKLKEDIADIEPKLTFGSFSEEQLKNYEYVVNLIEAMRVNPEYFPNTLKGYVDRYAKIFWEIISSDFT